MPRKRSEITVTDQFCGAGGSSEGVVLVAKKKKLNNGLKVTMALNHWKLAIETHNTNHPDTDHDCTDISACDPRKYPSTDILITSPECTNHTLAKGTKRNQRNQGDLFKMVFDPAAERSRATMWDVPRFAEYHNYNLIIVENVVDARYWVMFDAWLMAMHSLGYAHECVYLNSMHMHPTPQSRDRLYVVFWKKGNKKPDLAIRPHAYCHTCAKDTESYQSWKDSQKKFGKYNSQYVFRCPACNNQVEPYYYAAFNCIDWSLPGTRIGDRKKPLSENTMRRIAYGIEKYWSQPQIITTRYTTGLDFRVRSAAGHPLPTQPDIVSPFIIKNYSGKQRPMQTSEPLGSITCQDHHGIVSPEAFDSFLTYYYGGSDMASHITEAARTFRGGDGAGLVTNVKPKIEDCYYRMLVADEVKLGMAFRKSYIVLGNVKEQVKQLGNAVTPPAMEFLIERGIETLL